MSKRQDRGRIPFEEGEKFMALLLAAQKTRHKCKWVQYFKEIGNRLVKEHFGEAEKDE